MKPAKALKHFKTRQALIEAAAVSKQAVAKWFKNDWIPKSSAAVLASQSGGRLKFNPRDYELTEASGSPK